MRCPACLPLRLLDLRVGAEQLLDVMAELVRDHIVLREVLALNRVDSSLKLVSGVDALVYWAIERPHGRLRRAAARTTLPSKKTSLGASEFPGRSCENRLPTVLSGPNQTLHGLALRRVRLQLSVRYPCRSAALRSASSARRGLPRRAGVFAKATHAEHRHQDNQHDDDGSPQPKGCRSSAKPHQ
jgi:hypothetical protein